MASTFWSCLGLRAGLIFTSGVDKNCTSLVHILGACRVAKRELADEVSRSPAAATVRRWHALCMSRVNGRCRFTLWRAGLPCRGLRGWADSRGSGMRGLGSTILTAALAAAVVVAGMPHALCFCGCADALPPPGAAPATPETRRPPEHAAQTAAPSGSCPYCDAARLRPWLSAAQESDQGSGQSCPGPQPCQCADCQPVVATAPSAGVNVALPTVSSGWLPLVAALALAAAHGAGPGVARCGPGPPEAALSAGYDLCLLLGRLLL